jgi:hypothetical protein
MVSFKPRPLLLHIQSVLYAFYWSWIPARIFKTKNSSQKRTLGKAYENNIQEFSSYLIQQYLPITKASQLLVFREIVAIFLKIIINT